MKRLVTIDKKDYDESWEHSLRPSTRGIIVKDGKLALIHNMKYDYYEFPGGGIEAGESHMQALAREVKEETGLTVIPESIREFGSALRLSKSRIFENTIFEQEGYYYFCEVEDNIGEQKLEDYEKAEGMTLEFVTPDEALRVNKFNDHGEDKDSAWIERETRMLELVMAELENK